MAFRLNKAIMNNYSVVTDQLIGNVVLDVLQKPTVPSGPVNKFQPTALYEENIFNDDRCVMWIDRNFVILKGYSEKTKRSFKGNLMQSFCRRYIMRRSIRHGKQESTAKRVRYC